MNMAGLFDPSMFDPQAGMNPTGGLLARLSQMINQPTGTSGVLPGQPGMDAQASGLMPPPPPQGAPPMSPPMQGAPQGGGILDALTGFLGNHSNALMGLGAGIASGGLQRGVPGMAAGGQMDYQRNLQQSSLAGTYQALIASGIPAAQAQAMTLNPELLKTLAPTYMAKPTWGKIGVDPLTGQEQMGWIDSNTRKVTDAAGNPIGGGGAGSGGIDFANSRNLPPDQWFSQFPPGFQSSVIAYMNGDTMPTGNPRGIPAAKIKEVAQQYGQMLGIPVTDEAFGQKKQLLTQLGSTAATSMGGQLNSGLTALDHLDKMAKSFVDLQNSNGIGLGPVAKGVNTLQGIGNEQGAKQAAVVLNGQHYGQEAARFYTNSPGDAAARHEFGNTISPTVPPATAAAAIEKEAELIPGKFDQFKSQIQSVFGNTVPGSPQNLQAKAALARIAEAEKYAESIKQSVAALRRQAKGDYSQAPAAGMTPTQATGLPPGWSVQVK